MLFIFRLIGTGKQPFFRDFEIRKDQTFYDLHNIIQNELVYDKNQLASFYLADSNWEKGLEINLFDMTEDTFKPVIIMDRTPLCELIFNVTQRLLYVFDFFSDRAFFIELISMTSCGENAVYPRCVAGEGVPPEQLIIKDPDLPDTQVNG
jgi:hypothetical protein